MMIGWLQIKKNYPPRLVRGCSPLKLQKFGPKIDTCHRGSWTELWHLFKVISLKHCIDRISEWFPRNLISISPVPRNYLGPVSGPGRPLIGWAPPPPSDWRRAWRRPSSHETQPWCWGQSQTDSRQSRTLVAGDLLEKINTSLISSEWCPAPRRWPPWWTRGPRPRWPPCTPSTRSSGTTPRGSRGSIRTRILCHHPTLKVRVFPFMYNYLLFRTEALTLDS